ncbi:tyrosine-type recombinase/integrase [Tunturiibacter gelidiferens]|uniref:tyrosine-type recombinase/integrase n=1 Tax=Tunturiibacter gelidiferens TaxID=3069689 RepID=UPI003D9BF0E8
MVQSKDGFANDQANSIGEWGRFHSMARRRYQHGSLTRDGDRWIARWREDVALPSGEVKRIHKKQVIGTVTDLPTKKLAERALAKRLEPINNVEYRPTSMVSFGLFAEKWMKEIMIHHKPSSRSSEKSVINVQLVPFFGEHQLRNINLEMIQRFVNTSEKSPKTVKNAVSVLIVMWDMARAWGYAQHNPFPRGTNGHLLLKLPMIVKGKTYHFTVEEALAIIDKAQGRWKTFFRILAETGMRPGELAGLRVEDVGVQTLRVAQSVWQQQVQTPKTVNATRTFAISGSLAEEVRQLIAESEPNSYGLVFVTEPGRKRNTGESRSRWTTSVSACSTRSSTSLASVPRWKRSVSGAVTTPSAT